MVAAAAGGGEQVGPDLDETGLALAAHLALEHGVDGLVVRGMGGTRGMRGMRGREGRWEGRRESVKEGKR